MRYGQECQQKKLGKGSNMKKILYIRADGIYYDSRATKEIKTLLDAGYYLIVLGWDRDGKSVEKCGIDFAFYKEQLSFLFYNKTLHGSARTNLKYLYGWLEYVRNQIKALHEDISVVHACDLDTILFAYKLIKKYKLKLVYDIYDYFVDSHYYLPKLLNYFLEKQEIKIINTADVSIICTEERMEQLTKSKPKKVVIIHNSPNVEYLKNDIIYDYFYCGTLSDHRLLRETFDRYSENTDIRVAIGGYGAYEREAKENAKQYDNFVFLGPMSYSDCLVNESKSVCLSAIYKPTIRNHRLCAPNKFYEALALGKPVIVCKGTGIDKIVAKHNIGIVINYDATELYDAIRQLVNNPDSCKEMGLRARKLYEEKYSWSIMSSRLLTIYKNI